MSEIVQVAFEIPDDLAVGLATGLYRRLGGVVRYATGPNKGQIVRHLKEVMVLDKKEEALSLAEKAIQIGKAHKKLALGVMIVVGCSTTAGLVYTGINHKKQKKFKTSFQAYIEAIRTGNLDIEHIEDLENSLSDVKTIKLKACELSLLVWHIREYTLKLAEANNVDVDIEETETPIVDIQRYLEMQKEIFLAA